MVNLTQEQRTTEWYKDRLGKVTGSKVGTLMKSGRGRGETFSSTGMSYLYQLAGERILSNQILEDEKMFEYYIDQTNTTSKAMRFGIEQEGNAREMYQTLTGNEVTEVGLCRHPLIDTLASSPDGIVVENGVKGCVEIKCPSLATFAMYSAEIVDNDSLLRVNHDYFCQCQCHMACTGASFCDFIAYCPFVAYPLHVVRIQRDEDFIANMETRVMEAEEFINQKYNQLIK